MPFTPYHFGPGLLLKAAAPARFSFAGYAITQVVIDVESGYYLFTGQFPVHRTLHTFAAGTVVGAVVGLAVAGIGKRWLPTRWAEHGPIVIAEGSTGSALVGGVIGGVLHSFLDGIMHADIRPFRPLTASNPLHGVIGLGVLHLLCLATAVVGVAVLSHERHWRIR